MNETSKSKEFETLKSGFNEKYKNKFKSNMESGGSVPISVLDSTVYCTYCFEGLPISSMLSP